MSDKSATSNVRAEWPLPRGLIILVGTASAMFVVAGLRSAAGIVGPTFLALVLTVAVYPLRGVAARRGWPGWSGTLVGLLGVYVLVLGLSFSMLIAVGRFATLLPQYADDFNDLVQSATTKLKGYGLGQSQIDSITGAFDVSQVASAAGGLLADLVGVASSLSLVIALLFFLGIDASRFPQKLAQNRAERLAVVTALESFARGTRRYLVVSTVFGFIVAVLDTAFLALTPIPVPILWGLLAFITNFIPNIGFVIGLVPPAILGLLEGGPDLMLLVIGVYVILNFLIQSMIQPKVVGDAVGLSVSITFLSLVFWAWVLGAIGALLAIPLTLLAKALLVDVDRDSAWLKPLLSSGSASTRGSADEPAQALPKVGKSEQSQ